jgi:hypothetical protein
LARLMSKARPGAERFAHLLADVPGGEDRHHRMCGGNREHCQGAVGCLMRSVSALCMVAHLRLTVTEQAVEPA